MRCQRPRVARRHLFVVAVEQALADTFTAHTNIRISRFDLVNTGREENGYRFFDFQGTPETKRQRVEFANAARAKKVLYAMPDRLVPAYYIELDLGKTGTTNADLWGYVVSAETGAVLERSHLTQDVAFNYKVWADAAAPHTPFDGPIADWTPHPTGVPTGAVPPFVAPTMISMEGFNTNPSSLGRPVAAAICIRNDRQ
jgi:hypothetical protein